MERSLHDRIKGLYDKNPLLIERYNHHCYNGSKISTDLDNIMDVTLKKDGSDIASERFDIQQLERFAQASEKTKDDAAHSLSKLFAFLPPNTVNEEFGEEALFWTWHRFNVGIERSEKILEAYAAITGRDAGLLRNARQSLWSMSFNRDLQDIQLMYRLFTELDTKLSSIDLERLLLGQAKNAVDRSRLYNIVNRYSLQPRMVQRLNDKGRGFDRDHGQVDPDDLRSEMNRALVIYMDTPIGISLDYDRQPVALITFIARDNILEIHQIQGIREVLLDGKGDLVKKLRTKGLFGFDWKKALVTVTEEIARSFDIYECCIKSAHNNRWTKTLDNNGEPHLDMEDAKDTYDHTARSLGYRSRYEKSIQRRDWYKILI